MKLQTIEFNRGRMVVGRIFPKLDLIKGIEQICKENNIRFGIIVSMIGSLSKGLMVYAIPNKDSQIGISYSEETYIEGPLELLGGQGFIGENEDGNFQIHLHGIMGNKNMEIMGGHLVTGGNIILATTEIAIMEVSEGQLIRKFNEKIGFPLFNFFQDKISV